MKKELFVFVLPNQATPVNTNKVTSGLKKFVIGKNITITQVSSYGELVQLLKNRMEKIKATDDHTPRIAKVLVITTPFVEISPVSLRSALWVAQELGMSITDNLLWSVIDSSGDPTKPRLHYWFRDKEPDKGCIKIIKRVWDDTLE